MTTHLSLLCRMGWNEVPKMFLSARPKAKAWHLTGIWIRLSLVIGVPPKFLFPDSNTSSVHWQGRTFSLFSSHEHSSFHSHQAPTPLPIGDECTGTRAERRPTDEQWEQHSSSSSALASCLHWGYVEQTRQCWFRSMCHWNKKRACSTKQTEINLISGSWM